MPLVITIDKEPAEGVALAIERALPAVAPDHVKEMSVVDPVIELLVITNV